MGWLLPRPSTPKAVWTYSQSAKWHVAHGCHAHWCMGIFRTSMSYCLRLASEPCSERDVSHERSTMAVRDGRNR